MLRLNFTHSTRHEPSGRADATSYTPGTTGLNLSRNYPMYSTAAVNGLNFWDPATQSSPFMP